MLYHFIGQRRPRPFDECDKCLDAFLRPLLKLNGHERVFHRSEHGAKPVMAGGQQAFHRHVAQAARGRVGDAQQADVVVRIDEHLEIREKIPDLAPVKKTLPADEMITYAGLAQRRFNRPRLDVRAEQNRILFPRNAMRQPGEFDLAHDFRCLNLFIITGPQKNLRSLAFLRPE